MDNEPDLPRKRSKGLLIGGICAACVVVFALAALWAHGSFATHEENLTTTTDPFADVDRNQSVDAVTVKTAPTPTEDVSSAPSETLTGPEEWTYWNSFDQVRSGTIYHAALTSENSVSFEFPYEGGSTLTLTVRKHPVYGNDVIFRISKGQFVCGIDNCSGTINYGDGPEAIALSEPTDNSSDTLFAVDGDEIIKHLKATKKVIVELPFYQEGNRQFTFESTASLVWQTSAAATADTTTVDEGTEDAD